MNANICERGTRYNNSFQPYLPNTFSTSVKKRAPNIKVIHPAFAMMDIASLMLGRLFRGFAWNEVHNCFADTHIAEASIME